MSDMNEFLKRAASKAGYARTRYAEKDLPAEPSQVTVLYHFGDIRSTFVLSSLLLQRFREEMRGSKYFVLCSWPGYECLFPYVDEYWSLKDASEMRDLYYTAKGFENQQEAVKKHVWDLNWFFEDVVDYRAFQPYYDTGITQSFFERFRHVRRFLPHVLSLAVLGETLSQQFLDRTKKKVFVYPTLRFGTWRRWRADSIPCPKRFWSLLAERLVEAGFLPVFGFDQLTHSMLGDVPEECVHVPVSDVSRMLAVMRHADCCLDLFAGNSRLAIAARSPFVAYDERQRFFSLKEYEVDDLCSDHSLARKYIFSFPHFVLDDHEEIWKGGLIEGVIPRVEEVISMTDRNLLPSTSESSIIVPYTNVRRLRSKRLGTRFIRRKKES